MKELQVYVNHWIIYCACGGSRACLNAEFDLRRIFTKVSSIASKFQELTYQTVPKVNRIDRKSLKSNSILKILFSKWGQLEISNVTVYHQYWPWPVLNCQPSCSHGILGCEIHVWHYFHSQKKPFPVKWTSLDCAMSWACRIFFPLASFILKTNLRLMKSMFKMESIVEL